MRLLLSVLLITGICSFVCLAQTAPESKCVPPKSWSAPLPEAQSVHLEQVIFQGDPRLPRSEQGAIAEELRKVNFDANPEHGDWNGEIEERVRNAWETRGYFEVQVKANSHISTENPLRGATTISVTAGDQYRLKTIGFSSNNVASAASPRGECTASATATLSETSNVASTDELRSEFPIGDGEIFNREKVGLGLENLRKLYGKHGYINFSVVPQTDIDEFNKTISLKIDLDEGKQFRIASVKFDSDAIDSPSQFPIQKLQPGTVYDSELIGQLIDQSRKSGSEWTLDDLEVIQHSETTTVDVLFHLRRCVALQD